MKLQLIFMPLLLSLEVSLLGPYLKDLLRLVVLFKSFLMKLMMVQLIQLDLFALCLAQRRKKSACWEATQFVFPSVFSGLDVFYYCSNIIVSLFFKLCAKFIL